MGDAGGREAGPGRPARHVRTVDDVLALLDTLFESTADRWTDGAGSRWWDDFYADRTRPVPFFADRPDENLVAWHEAGLLPAGRALDLGCGAGRNVRFLAARGHRVDGIDLSAEAIGWARDEGVPEGASLHVGDAFGDAGSALAGPYDLVYDSGCLHHLPPHRRVAYLALLDRLLAPGGLFGVVCFADGAMGATRPDEELYLRGGLEGGLAFTPEALTWIFDRLEPVEVRPMRAQEEGSDLFGQDFLLTALFRRPVRAPGTDYAPG